MKNPQVEPPRSLIIKKYATSKLPTQYGQFEVDVYRHGPDNEESLAVRLSDFEPGEPVFARIHSECLTGEVLGSIKCDCREQLELALRHIQTLGKGVLIYLRQEGRGIGLGNKIRAYALQDAGADTIEANHQLGFDTDLREFDVAAAIFKDLGIQRVILHTNNPNKIQAMENGGIEIVSRVPAHGAVNDHNRRYLEVKHRVLGHHLAPLFAGGSSDD